MYDCDQFFVVDLVSMMAIRMTTFVSHLEIAYSQYDHISTQALFTNPIMRVTKLFDIYNIASYSYIVFWLGYTWACSKSTARIQIQQSSAIDGCAVVAAATRSFRR